MKKKTILFFILITSFGFSQDKATNERLLSLEKKLSTNIQDSLKLDILLGLGRDYAIYSNKRVFEFNQKGIELAKKINRPIAIAEAYANYSSYYERINDTLKQKEYLDKIFALGKEKKNNSILGKAHFEKAFYFWEKSPSQSKHHFELAEKFYKKDNNKRSLSDVYLQFGYLYQDKFNDYNKALFNYIKYVDLFDKDDFSLINTYQTIAGIYKIQSNYEKALEYFVLSDKLFKKHKQTDSHHYGYLLNNFANTYKELKNYTESQKYYDQSLKKFLSIENHHYSSILYSQKADLFLTMKDTKNALKNINLATQEAEKIERCLEKENAHTTIGFAYYEMKNYSKALEFHLKALNGCPMNTTFKDFEKQQYNVGASYLELAKNIEQISNPTIEIPKSKNKLLQLSENYLQKAKQNSQSTNNLVTYASSVNLLHEVYDLLGNKVKALEYYKEYVTYKDSLQSIENRELLVQNQMQFEFDQQEKVRKVEQEAKDALVREEIAKEKSTRNMALAGVGIFVILAGFSIFAYYQKRKDNKIIALEKQKSDALLLNILPEEVANELKEKGTTDAKHFDSVSIMFTDFKDFTKLSEKIPSKELIEELNYCFKAFDEIVVKHGVEKIKTIGDSYMAVCGLPIEEGNHAQKIVQAAIEIRDFIEDYKVKRQSEGKSFFEMRTGINSGEVVAGIVGIKKFAYDIWGDAVNTASRMESNGLIGKVNISESTYNLIKDDFNFEYRGEIETKGKGEIKMYLVENKTNNVDFEKAKAFILNKLDNELSKKLNYHNLEHILDVYNASIQYAKLEGINEEETILLRTASLFHDSGFIVKADGHEQISCEFAEQYLPNFSYSKSQIEKIKGMIMATKIPQSPKNHLEEILADADLDYLGRDDFEKISERLFQELALNDRNEWNKIQISFFEKHNYFTDSAKRMRNEKKQENLEKIKAQTKL